MKNVKLDISGIEQSKTLIMKITKYNNKGGLKINIPKKIVEWEKLRSGQFVEIQFIRKIDPRYE